MSDDELRRHIRLQLVNDRLVADAVVAVLAHTHCLELAGDRQPPRHLGDGAVEIGVEDGEVGHARKELQRLAHDVNGDRRMQRGQVLVALEFVDQLRRNDLVLPHRGPAADGTMADGHGSRKVA